ncbi:MAG: ABC transporter permease subunit [Desulfobacula sp.]|nr:ABC transporter permease subunit [Desulfobacula sp.]
MIYAYILFMVFPLYNAMESLDTNQIEGARDLGGSWPRIHWKIVIPHSKPEIAVGCIMSFMLAAGSVAAPQLLGRPSSFWFAQIIYTNYETANWNLGTAYSKILARLCLGFMFIRFEIFTGFCIFGFFIWYYGLSDPDSRHYSWHFNIFILEYLDEQTLPDLYRHQTQNFYQPCHERPWCYFHSINHCRGLFL